MLQRTLQWPHRGRRPDRFPPRLRDGARGHRL